MTGKRFTFDEDVNDDRMYEMGVFLDNGEIMETTDVLECLNNLHEENERLHDEIFRLRTERAYDDCLAEEDYDCGYAYLKVIE